MSERKSRPHGNTQEDRDELMLWRRVTADLQTLTATRGTINGVLEQLNQLPAMQDKNMDQRTSQKGAQLCQEAITGTIEEKAMAVKLVERLEVLIALQEAAEAAARSSPVPAVATPEPARRRKRVIDPELVDQSPRKVRGMDSSPSKNAPIIPIGQRVAAKVSAAGGSVDEWILAVIRRYYPDKLVYEVEDEEADDSGNVAKYEQYQLAPKYVIATGSSGNHRSSEFPAGHTVLALYPNTTCFYKASVITPPHKAREPRFKGQYVVRFEDDNGQAQAVPPDMILDFPANTTNS